MTGCQVEEKLTVLTSDDKERRKGNQGMHARHCIEPQQQTAKQAAVRVTPHFMGRLPTSERR